METDERNQNVSHYRSVTAITGLKLVGWKVSDLINNENGINVLYSVCMLGQKKEKRVN